MLVPGVGRFSERVRSSNRLRVKIGLAMALQLWPMLCELRRRLALAAWNTTRRCVVWGLSDSSRNLRERRQSVGNAEHLSILNTGVKEWNRWRLLNPSIVPDLSGLHLCHRNLRGVYLVGAQLQDACLDCTDLWDALLTWCQKSKACRVPGGARRNMAVPRTARGCQR